MEPWAFDSAAMRGLLPLILAHEFPIVALPVARTDDDLKTSLMILDVPGEDGANSQH